MGTPRDGGLPAKQLVFVREYLRHGNATQAVITAGYSTRAAKQQGSRLLTKVDVAAAIESGRKAFSAPAIADATERRERLSMMFRDKKGHPLARLKAADILNKMDGIYVTKHVGPDGGPIQADITTIRRIIVRPSPQ